MTVLLIWPLAGIDSPRIITPDLQVIDLLETDITSWEAHISIENKRRVLEEVRRWKAAKLAGAETIEALGYAIGGAGIDFQAWLMTEKEVCPLHHLPE